MGVKQICSKQECTIIGLLFLKYSIRSVTGPGISVVDSSQTVAISDTWEVCLYSWPQVPSHEGRRSVINGCQTNTRICPLNTGIV